MNTLDDVFVKLWADYAAMNKQAQAIHQLLESKGERVENDHIAFRTYNHKKVGIQSIAKTFEHFGYIQKGEYTFEAKKLFAKHYEHPEEGRPRIFISELKLEEFSESLQETVNQLIDQVDASVVKSLEFPMCATPWPMISFETYNQLKAESEYAAWMAVFGYRANHFTVLINALKSIHSIEELNEFLKSNGFTLNTSGGEIKGTEKDFLKQSSTMADPVEVNFSDGIQTIPGCYYEFAERFKLPNGELYQGFVAKSADKIFESTDNK